MDEQQHALRAEVADLRARLSAIESQLSGGVETAAPLSVAGTRSRADPGFPLQHAPAPDAPRTTDRRSALKLAGAAAAGLAGGAVVANAGPAAAASGDALILGSTTNTTNSATEMTSGSQVGLQVTAVPMLSTGIRGLASANGGVGVLGTAGTGSGVVGEGFLDGVWGRGLGPAPEVNGVRGYAAAGTAIRGTSDTGTALRGSTTQPGGIGLALSTNDGPSIRFGVGATVPPSSGTWMAGDVAGSPSGLWFCYLAGVGPASKWVKMSSALVTLPVPVRVYDSRPGQAPLAIGPKTKLVAATPRTIDCKGNSSGVPTGASSVLLNLVVTGTTTGDSGYLAVYKAGVPFPNTSNLNWSAAGQNVAVTTVSAVDAQSQVNIWAASATDVVIDVIGFYP